MDRIEQQENTPAEPGTQPVADVYIEQARPVPTVPADAIILRREVFNYLVIAVVFALLGGFIGYMVASSTAQTNEALVEEIRAAVAGSSGSISPEMIDELAAALLPQISEAVAAARPPSLEDPNSRFTVSLDESRFIGPADAEVVMIEFGDFNCSFCKRFHDETLQPLIENYGDRVQFAYRDYPILADTSLTAALASQCAAEQGGFWDYHSLLYTNIGNFSRDSLIAYATQLDLDVTAFTACLDEERYLDTVVSDYREAEGMGIRGTPAFFINGRPVSGAQPYEVFARIIEEELAANAVETEGETAES